MSFSLIIHGGAGGGSKDIFKQIENKTGIKNLEEEYHNALNECLNVGKDILSNKGTAIDAVTGCIKYLENNILFNAGRGSVTDCNNVVYNDSCIMCGKTKKWGATCLTNNIKNPIELSKKIMENNSIFVGGNEGALKLAKKFGISITDESYFHTEFRDILSTISHDLGTVGAVAFDTYSNLCAGTSTGGLQNKEVGRIGDSPLIGVSTVADNDGVAVSCTGNGEGIIKNNLASQILYRYKFKNESLQEIVDNTFNNMDALCGIICIDKNGKIYHKANTPRMYLGYVSSDDEPNTLIWNN